MDEKGKNYDIKRKKRDSFGIVCQIKLGITNLKKKKNTTMKNELSGKKRMVIGQETFKSLTLSIQ